MVNVMRGYWGKLLPLCAFLILIGGLSGVQAQTPPVAPAPAAAAAAPAPGSPEAIDAAAKITLADGYVLGEGDTIEVSVLGREEYRARTQVQVDGTVQLPYINNIQATGRTVLQLRDAVRTALVSGGYYTDPAVSIQVVNYASRYVIVLGEVASPGIVPVDRSYRASEILARVGGPRPSAAEELIIRRASGEEQSLDVQTVSIGGGDEDPVNNPGDKVYVPTAATFYIYGQINGPGVYKVERAMTMRMAIARAGGITALGSEKRIKVYRDANEIKKFDLNQPIQDGDVVVIGERFF